MIDKDKSVGEIEQPKEEHGDGGPTTRPQPSDAFGLSSMVGKNDNSVVDETEIDMFEMI